MDEKERQIISELRKDSRTSLSAISQSVGMPISTIYDKINRMQRENLIHKYALLIDFPKLGYHHHAHLALKVDKAQRKGLSSFLENHASINSLHEIDGGFDFMFETVHKDVKEYSLFLEELKEKFSVLELKEYQVINIIDRERFR
ncbi:MAG: winged helix-turn-helix transcriptional regulator [Candidatus Woesearchaeota archaeon]|jgi:DNA-binding Lrp family transcriptional regulator